MFSATWPHLGELQDAGSVGLVARGEFIRVNASLHALFICNRFFFYFLGQLPLTSLIVSLGSVYLKQRFHLCSHRSSF